MTEKTEFAHRLKSALEAAGYEPRPVVVEKHFNSRFWGRPVSFQAVRRWLRGDSIPEQDKLMVLAEWLEVEPHYLRFGGTADPERKRRKAGEKLVPPEERALFDTYLSLPADQRKVVRGVIEALAEAGRKQ